MLRRILLAAIVAGLLGGTMVSALQEFTTTPLIIHAEQFETAAPASASAAPEPWSPGDGIERTLYTSLGNIIIGVGFALLLVACFALHGREIDGRRGVIWGLAGFAVFSLAPALGLPPEVPGGMAAELATRQQWWLAAAAATALGLALMVFGRGWILPVLGIIAIAAPHLIGAPHPDKTGGAAPAELAGHFVAASLVTAAVFWAVLGWLSGTFYRRFA